MVFIVPSYTLYNIIIPQTILSDDDEDVDILLRFKNIYDDYLFYLL